MPRFRCVFPTQTAAGAKDAGTRGRTARGMHLAYEFDAPDLTTLKAWLQQRNLPVPDIAEVSNDTAPASSAD
ncbi:hypothetical protein FJZ36_03805 [Candidatus Poribacteria bacterium]|nr:hypothetical protein [Candidatus Poribacteria bacterium]